MNHRTPSVLAAVGLLSFVALGARPAPAAAADAPCDAFEIAYALDARIDITDTPMGKGDGSHDIGPGVLVVRFANQGGRPGGAAELVRYETDEKFTVVTKALGMTTQAHVDTVTRGTPDACGVVARGALEGGELRWDGPLAGVRTDGTVTCEGSFCGKFGAPARGTSPFHVAPHDADFASLEFADGLGSFTMAPSVVSRLDSPSQTTSVSLAGRETGRKCVAANPCR